MNKGLLEDSSFHDNQVDDMFVQNSLLDLSNHDQIKKDVSENSSRFLPRISAMSDGDHAEYSGLYSDGGLLGNWKPPPDPRIAARKKLIEQRLKMLSCVFIFIIAIILVCIFAVPVYIQGLIDDSTLKITSVINITNPGIDHVDLSMDARVKCDSPFDVNLHFKNTIIKFHNSKTNEWPRVVKLNLPAVRVRSGHEKLSVDETAKILSYDNWNDFTRAVMLENEVKMKIISSTVSVNVKGWLGFLGINYHDFTMEKSVNVKGMSGLPGAVVLDYDVFDDPDIGGEFGLNAPPIQIATVKVPNYSGFGAVGVGFLSGKVLYGDMDVGWLTSTKNESLIYGDDNLFILSGPLTPSNITEFCALMSGYLTGSNYYISLQLSNYTTIVYENTTTGTSSRTAVAAAESAFEPQYDMTSSNEVMQSNDITTEDLKKHKEGLGSEMVPVKVNVPCSTQYLFNEALNGFTFSAYLAWPEGRVNMTAENVVDVAKVKVGRDSDVPLWIGVYNPFSANIFLTFTDFDVYWSPPPPAPLPSPMPSLLPSVMPYPLPTIVPSSTPTNSPTRSPVSPSSQPIIAPTVVPIAKPTQLPIPLPIPAPSAVPVPAPSSVTISPVAAPVPAPSSVTISPVAAPVPAPSSVTISPVPAPTKAPSPPTLLHRPSPQPTAPAAASQHSLTTRRSLLQQRSREDGNGEYVAYAINDNLFINCYPKSFTLTGNNLNTSLIVTIPLSDPAAIQMTQVLAAEGYTYTGVIGSFGLRVGTLELVLDYFQAVNIPTCDLDYVQHHEYGGMCSNPPSNNITGV